MRREWELEDLIECWTLDEAEPRLLANKTGPTRLGFALMLKFFEQEARFPRREDVPKAAVEFVSGQVKVDAALRAPMALARAWPAVAASPGARWMLVEVWAAPTRACASCAA